MAQVFTYINQASANQPIGLMALDYRHVTRVSNSTHLWPGIYLFLLLTKWPICEQMTCY